MDFSDRFLLAMLWHLIADWLLQNHWMATHKHKLTGAAYAHGGIHLLGMLLIFPYPFAIVIAALHMLIDTRVPLSWWRSKVKQTGAPYDRVTTFKPTSTRYMEKRVVGKGQPMLGETNMILALVGDQVLHFMVLALACWVLR